MLRLIGLSMIKRGAAVCGSLLLASLAGAQPTELINDCDSCHGENGISAESDVPTIGGVSAFVIEDYMFLFADQARLCRESEHRTGDADKPATDMCAIAQELSEAEIGEIAEYYAGQEYVAAVQEFDAELAAAGASVHRAQCERCHSDGGSYADDDAGILAGQWIPYLEQAFADYASGERESLEENMKEKMDALDAESTIALIHFYASQQ